MVEWCRAIMADKEDAFIADLNLPHWKDSTSQEQPTTSAQAVAASTTDPASEEPAVDGQLFSDDAGDGAVDGMCVSASEMLQMFRCRVGR